jgi:hypothetical protein
MTKPTSKPTPLPKFRSEAKEREFWESKTNDATQYFEASKMVAVKFKNLKQLDVPYQSLMKVWLTEKLRDTAKG